MDVRFHTYASLLGNAHPVSRRFYRGAYIHILRRSTSILKRNRLMCYFGLARYM